MNVLPTCLLVYYLWVRTDMDVKEHERFSCYVSGLQNWWMGRGTVFDILMTTELVDGERVLCLVDGERVLC